MRFIAERPGFQGAASQFVQPQTKPVPFIRRIFFDELKSLHGVQEAEDGGLVQVEFAGKLGDAHFGAIFAEMQQEPKGFLQGFAGAHVTAAVTLDFSDAPGKRQMNSFRTLHTGENSLGARCIVDRTVGKSI